MNIEKIIASRKPKVGNVMLIAIDGHGGSGKSALAELLSQKLSAQIIHQDNFASWDNPLNWWPKLIKQVFEPIETGANTLSYERSKWWENHHPEPAIDEPVTPIMILEGVSSLRKEFRDYISLSIFVDTPIEICLKRGLARDSGTGKPKEEIRKLWEQWLKDENEYIARDNPKEYADIVIDGTKPFEAQLAEF
jgi:uridine kinase